MSRSLDRRLAKMEGVSTKSEELEIKFVIIDSDFERGLYAHGATHDFSTGVTTEIPDEDKVWHVPTPEKMGALYARYLGVNRKFPR